MVAETAERLLPVFGARNLWAVTNAQQVSAVRKELRRAPATQILIEPIGRNTAAAIGLAAFHLIHKHGDVVMAVLPSDSYVADVKHYRVLIQEALALASRQNNLVVLGITPTRPETGYGYIERGRVTRRLKHGRAYAIRRFTEKPEVRVARRYFRSQNYLWNAGMFFWRASTFLAALGEFLPKTYETLSELSKNIGTTRYDVALKRIYPKLENISVDYAIMEPATRAAAKKRPYEVSVIPAAVGWSDIGSWAAVHELSEKKRTRRNSSGDFFLLDSSGNYFWSPKKFVAAIGVKDLIFVDTDDAVLLCSRDRSQDVAKIVKWLEQKRRKALL